MAEPKAKNIGVDTDAPRQICGDAKCPYHGHLGVRGRQFTGTVISTKMRKTAVVEFERLNFLKKYERYEKRRTRLKVHNPDCVNAQDGDIVRLIECRPLSKTKNFVITHKLGAERLFKERMEAREASKADKPKRDEEQKITEEK